MSNDGQPMPVKVQLGDEKARLSVPAAELTVDGLTRAVRHSFDVPRGQKCRLRFIDDEGDPCKLATPEDLREAVRLRVHPAPLKLVVALQPADEERDEPTVHLKREAPEPIHPTFGVAVRDGEAQPPDHHRKRSSVRHDNAGSPAGASCVGSPRKFARCDSPNRDASFRCPSSQPSRAQARATEDATVSAIFMQRDKRRYRTKRRPSPWRPCTVPFQRVLIRVVAHKTKPLPPAAMALGDEGQVAEPDQFATTAKINTLAKVAHQINCAVDDLIHLNTERYGPLKASTRLMGHTLLLQPFRSRTIEGLLVAHNASQAGAEGTRFRIAALDPDGVNMPGDGPCTVDDTDPENICFEYEIAAEHLNTLPRKAEGVFGPVRLEPVADHWYDDHGEEGLIEVSS